MSVMIFFGAWFQNFFFKHSRVSIIIVTLNSSSQIKLTIYIIK